MKRYSSLYLNTERHYLFTLTAMRSSATSAGAIKDITALKKVTLRREKVPVVPKKEEKKLKKAIKEVTKPAKDMKKAEKASKQTRDAKGKFVKKK